MVLGVIWRKTGKKEGGSENTKTGNAGGVPREKYVSLKELSKDINIPYSPLMHKYYRTGDIEDVVGNIINVLMCF